MKRDELAFDRTLLANERTFMSYVRTALNILAISFTFIKFFQAPLFTYVGYALLPTAAATVFLGYNKYARTKNSIAKQRKKFDQEHSPQPDIV